MLFTPDASKPAQEVLVSRKKNVQIQIHLIISLNNIHVGRVSKTPRHLALDGKLIFNYFRLCYLENKKRHICNKKLRHSFTQKSFVTIYGI